MTPDLSRMARRPGDADTPVFREPWEAQAFAMVLSLHKRGVFTWTEWANALALQISLAQAKGDADLGDTYYQHWLSALFASFLFLGQSLGVVLATSLISSVGSSAVIACGGGVMALLGLGFAWALQRRAYFFNSPN